MPQTWVSSNNLHPQISSILPSCLLYKLEWRIFESQLRKRSVGIPPCPAKCNAWEANPGDREHDSPAAGSTRIPRGAAVMEFLRSYYLRGGHRSKGARLNAHFHQEAYVRRPEVANCHHESDVAPPLRICTTCATWWLTCTDRRARPGPSPVSSASAPLRAQHDI